MHILSDYEDVNMETIHRENFSYRQKRQSGQVSQALSDLLSQTRASGPQLPPRSLRQPHHSPLPQPLPSTSLAHVPSLVTLSDATGSFDGSEDDYIRPSPPTEVKGKHTNIRFGESKKTESIEEDLDGYLTPSNVLSQSLSERTSLKSHGYEIKTWSGCNPLPQQMTMPLFSTGISDQGDYSRRSQEEIDGNCTHPYSRPNNNEDCRAEDSEGYIIPSNVPPQISSGSTAKIASDDICELQDKSSCKSLSEMKHSQDDQVLNRPGSGVASCEDKENTFEYPGTS